jgi:hypothetical protein
VDSFNCAEDLFPWSRGLVDLLTAYRFLTSKFYLLVTSLRQKFAGGLLFIVNSK